MIPKRKHKILNLDVVNIEIHGELPQVLEKDNVLYIYSDTILNMTGARSFNDIINGNINLTVFENKLNEVSIKDDVKLARDVIVTLRALLMHLPKDMLGNLYDIVETRLIKETYNSNLIFMYFVYIVGLEIKIHPNYRTSSYEKAYKNVHLRDFLGSISKEKFEESVKFIERIDIDFKYRTPKERLIPKLLLHLDIQDELTPTRILLQEEKYKSRLKEFVIKLPSILRNNLDNYIVRVIDLITKENLFDSPESIADVLFSKLSYYNDNILSEDNIENLGILLLDLKNNSINKDRLEKLIFKDNKQKRNNIVRNFNDLPINIFIKVFGKEITITNNLTLYELIEEIYKKTRSDAYKFIIENVENIVDMHSKDFANEVLKNVFKTVSIIRIRNIKSNASWKITLNSNASNLTALRNLVRDLYHEANLKEYSDWIVITYLNKGTVYLISLERFIEYLASHVDNKDKFNAILEGIRLSISKYNVLAISRSLNKDVITTLANKFNVSKKLLNIKQQLVEESL